MNDFEKNEELLTTAALALGPLLSKIAFVGGATTILHFTEKLRDVRATVDVDVIIEASRTGFFKAEAQLRKLGFQPDPTLICRHRLGALIIDFMPTDASILGFSSRWYAGALRTAEPRTVGGVEIKVLTFPYFVATKLEAFNGRGKGDCYGSKDIEDLVTVFAGRRAFLLELKKVTGDVGTFIRASFRDLLKKAEFASAVHGHMPRDAGIDPNRIIADLQELADDA